MDFDIIDMLADEDIYELYNNILVIDSNVNISALYTCQSYCECNNGNSGIGTGTWYGYNIGNCGCEDCSSYCSSCPAGGYHICGNGPSSVKKWQTVSCTRN